MNVENWEFGIIINFWFDMLGYLLESLVDILDREYQVQVLLYKYEIFKRGDGYIVKLLMDRGEG